MMVNRLILEGDDDKYVVWNLLYNHTYQGRCLREYFDDQTSLKIKDGVDNLIDTMGDELQATDLGVLGVILDADVNLANQWARVTRVLDKHGCRNVPPVPNVDGTIVVSNNGKKVGIWVMPDNQHAGALEDFVGNLIAANDALWPKAKADVDSIPATDRRFKVAYQSKAQVHTWLAWQEEPGTRMGETFKKRYLDPNHPRAMAFVAWIKRLLA